MFLYLSSFVMIQVLYIVPFICGNLYECDNFQAYPEVFNPTEISWIENMVLSSNIYEIYVPCTFYASPLGP